MCPAKIMLNIHCFHRMASKMLQKNAWLPPRHPITTEAPNTNWLAPNPMQTAATSPLLQQAANQLPLPSNPWEKKKKKKNKMEPTPRPPTINGNPSLRIREKTGSVLPWTSYDGRHRSGPVPTVLRRQGAGPCR